MPIDEYRFRQSLGHFATGVTVVTTNLNGRLHGITVSAFTSLSLRPPLVLICIDNGAIAQNAIVEAGVFAVSVLSEQQEHLSRRFATPSDNKFEGVAWSEGNLNVPLLDDALVTIECRVTQTYPGGDHVIIVGEVLHATTNVGEPLLYFRGGYRELA